MFNQIQLKNFAKFLDMSEEKAEITLKKQAKYLKVNSTHLLKSYKVIYEMAQEAEAEKAKLKKYNSRNVLILKYKEEIIDLYCNKGFGYLKISKAIQIYHKVKISKSAIENFIKQNNLVKGAENG